MQPESRQILPVVEIQSDPARRFRYWIKQRNYYGFLVICFEPVDGYR